MSRCAEAAAVGGTEAATARRGARLMVAILEAFPFLRCRGSASYGGEDNRETSGRLRIAACKNPSHSLRPRNCLRATSSRHVFANVTWHNQTIIQHPQESCLYCSYRDCRQAASKRVVQSSHKIVAYTIYREVAITVTPRMQLQRPCGIVLDFIFSLHLECQTHLRRDISTLSRLKRKRLPEHKAMARSVFHAENRKRR
jgi:hypothetical protein